MKQNHRTLIEIITDDSESSLDYDRISRRLTHETSAIGNEDKDGRNALHHLTIQTLKNEDRIGLTKLAQALLKPKGRDTEAAHEQTDKYGKSPRYYASHFGGRLIDAIMTAHSRLSEDSESWKLEKYGNNIVMALPFSGMKASAACNQIDWARMVISGNDDLSRNEMPYHLAIEPMESFLKLQARMVKPQYRTMVLFQNSKQPRINPSVKNHLFVYKFYHMYWYKYSDTPTPESILENLEKRNTISAKYDTDDHRVMISFQMKERELYASIHNSGYGLILHTFDSSKSKYYTTKSWKLCNAEPIIDDKKSKIKVTLDWLKSRVQVKQENGPIFKFHTKMDKEFPEPQSPQPQCIQKEQRGGSCTNACYDTLFKSQLEPAQYRAYRIHCMVTAVQATAKARYECIRKYSMQGISVETDVYDRQLALGMKKIARHIAKYERNHRGDSDPLSDLLRKLEKSFHCLQLRQQCNWEIGNNIEEDIAVLQVMRTDMTIVVNSAEDERSATGRNPGALQRLHSTLTDGKLGKIFKQWQHYQKLKSQQFETKEETPKLQKYKTAIETTLGTYIEHRENTPPDLMENWWKLRYKKKISKMAAAYELREEIRSTGTNKAETISTSGMDNRR